MPARSRKRGRRGRPTGATAGPVAPRTAPAPRTAAAPGATAAPAPPRRSRSEERNEAIRAALTPLAPGERPWSLRIAAAVALLVGIGDLLQAVLGTKVRFASTHTSIAGVALFSIIMFVCAGGMWQLRYWAVLGFQALLALVILVFTFVLVTADNAIRAVVAIAVIGGGGVLFFKLVRVLSRLQLPSRSGQL